jgi:hypothetical protein
LKSFKAAGKSVASCPFAPVIRNFILPSLILPLG